MKWKYSSEVQVLKIVLKLSKSTWSHSTTDEAVICSLSQNHAKHDPFTNQFRPVISFDNEAVVDYALLTPVFVGILHVETQNIQIIISV